jgi:hypothetical protein
VPWDLSSPPELTLRAKRSNLGKIMELSVEIAALPSGPRNDADRLA